MDVVFPQYYEWHGEMLKLCRIADLDLEPEILHEIFSEIDESVRKFMKQGYNDAVPNPEKREAEIFWGFAFSPILITRQFGAIAYFYTLEKSHNLATRRVGENLLGMLFMKFCADRFIAAILRSGNRSKKRKESKKKKSR